MSRAPAVTGVEMKRGWLRSGEMLREGSKSVSFCGGGFAKSVGSN
jgi:hypothetical protein